MFSKQFVYKMSIDLKVALRMYKKFDLKHLDVMCNSYKIGNYFVLSPKYWAHKCSS